MHSQYFEKPISKRFIDAFPKFKDESGEGKTYFYETWQKSPFYLAELTEDDLKSIYNHLMAKYYNWHYVYLDDFGIAMNTMHVIHEFYPNTKERLQIAENLKNMSLEEFKKSGIIIDSQGANPKVKTEMDELIDLVDSQSASFQIKSQEQALRAKFLSLYDGIMDEFLTKFDYQFVKLYNGVNNYIYVNKEDEDNGL